jgi:tetratricopeptide (TPR) repeat protein
MSGDASALDLCDRAAACALALRESCLPESRIVMTTGRAVMGSRLPTGEAIETAAALFAEQRPGPAGIRIDESTAGLLGAWFHLERDEISPILIRRRDVASRDRVRQLLGRPTPFVGRDLEMQTLEALLAACIEQSKAHAVIVTGPAGAGKSRLRYEFVARIERRGGVEIIGARADPMQRGTPLGPIAGVIRQAVGVRRGETAEVGRRKLRQRVGRIRAISDATRVAEFLGEICGLSFPDDESPMLRAARQNPMLMGDQMRLAFEDLLLGISAERPVVLVLEDLQWGHVPAVSFIDAALRTLHDRRLLVLAFGRPEVVEAFPNLWAERPVTHLPLPELASDASEELVRALLSEETPAETVARIVQQAAGNPFYLEELIRAVAEGQGNEHLPGSILAMAQARIEALPESLRKLLRAASVFGETFWPGGLAVLLGTSLEEVIVGLSDLIDREIILKRPTSQFMSFGEEEFAFRHSLIREAAYAMLTDYDLTLGHRLAADWLQSVGEDDPLVLAQHFDRGGERARAAEAYVDAANDALKVNDFAAVIERAARGVQCGAIGERLAEIRLLKATAHHWRAEFADGERSALEALRGFSPCTVPWYRAAEEIAETCFPLGDLESLAALGQALYPPPGRTGPLKAFVVTAATVSMQLFLGGQYDIGESLMRRLDAAEARASRGNPLVTARTCFARATRVMVAGDLGAVLEHARRSVLAFDEAGDLRSAALMRTNLAYVYAEIGAYDQAEEPLRTAWVAAERLGLPAVMAAAKQNLALVLSRVGKLDEACAMVEECIALCVANQDQRMEGNSRIYMAQIRTLMGDPQGAEEQARRAIAVTEEIPPSRVFAQGMLAQILLMKGATEEAFATAREAMQALAALGSVDEGEAQIRLVHARVLDAAGDADGAREAIGAAREIVLAKAAKISDPALRESFLGRVPEHVQILALTEAWGGGATAALGSGMEVME